MSCILLWFRNDLRLHDNPALHEAVATGLPIIPLFIYAPEEESPWQPGAASRWWLHHSLQALGEALASKGATLVLKKGPSLPALQSLAKATQAQAVFWNRRYEPQGITQDTGIKKSLKAQGLRAESFAGTLLHEPAHSLNGQGKPYQVFTPFWKARLAVTPPLPPFPEPRSLSGYPNKLASEPLKAFDLLPRYPWDKGIAKTWVPGETGARASLKKFLNGAVQHYQELRDYPAQPGVSRLSPHLHFGEIGIRAAYALASKASGAGAGAFIRQLGWREFANHLLYHFPKTPEFPLREKFTHFAWRHDPGALKAWQRGRTGYPLVDAGMRELWQTGSMHNRLRMVVGSFLVKDLLLPWQAGAQWFWDTLVDADLANNTLGWQWIAGCGADAAPYFRIFHPITQSKKFDAEGNYLRKYLPELAKLPNPWIHCPWEAPPDVLKSAGVVLGKTYPQPIVDHAAARQRALAAYQSLSYSSP